MGCSKVVLAVNETITKFYNVLVSTVNKYERKYYHTLGGKKIYFCISVPKILVNSYQLRELTQLLILCYI